MKRVVSITRNGRFAALRRPNALGCATEHHFERFDNQERRDA